MMLNSPIVPVGNSFRTSAVVSMLRRMLNQLDSEKIENIDLRMYLNMAISEVGAIAKQQKPDLYKATVYYGLQGMLGDSAIPDARTYETYEVRMDASPISTMPPNPFQGERAWPEHAFSGTNAWALVDKIESISLYHYLDSRGNVFVGNAKTVTPAEFESITSGWNKNWRRSAFCAVHGPLLRVAFGDEFAVGWQPGPDFHAVNDIKPNTVLIWFTRNLLLDSLGVETDTNNPYNTWNALLDIPDEYVRLALYTAKMMAEEQINGQPLASTMNNIQLARQQLGINQDEQS